MKLEIIKNNCGTYDVYSNQTGNLQYCKSFRLHKDALKYTKD